ncbi:MAG: DUF3093 domain-containing protein [Actinobacteria bacterium]|nr:DUF3093 domain-containing protein [Actinomycetota bacterium]
MTTEGVDGKNPVFQERLWPSLGMWIFAFIMTTSLGIAYGRAYGNNLGLIVAISTTAAVALGLIVNTPLVQIDELNFRVGRARLPLKYVGKIQKLDEQQSRRARSIDANSNAHFQLRGGIKGTVIVEVTDPQDPHPYWQVSSRKPDLLIAALSNAKNI